MSEHPEPPPQHPAIDQPRKAPIARAYGNPRPRVKPNPRNRMAVLTDEQRDEVFDLCNKESLRSASSFLLRTYNIVMHPSSLSQWWRIYRKVRDTNLQRNSVAAMIKEIARPTDDGTPLDLRVLDTMEAVESALMIQAASVGGAEDYARLAKLKIERIKLANDARRIALLEKKAAAADEAAAIIRRNDITNEERVRLMREVLDVGTSD